MTGHSFTDSYQCLITGCQQLKKCNTILLKRPHLSHQCCEDISFFNYANKDFSNCLDDTWTSSSLSTFGRDLELLDGKLRLHPGGETKTDILLTLGEKQWCVRKLVEPAAHRGQNYILKLAEVEAVGRKCHITLVQSY